MATTYDKASLVMIPSGVKEDKLYSIKPTDGSGDFTFSRGSDIQATRVNASGLIEKAKVNLLEQSNNFDTTWVATSASVTGGQSGYDGSSDAWLLNVTATGVYRRITQSTGGSSNITNSIYAKAGTTDFIAVSDVGGGGAANVWFDLGTGTIGTIFGSQIIDANIESVGGGWYRCSVAHQGVSPSYALWFVADADNTTTGTIGANVYIQSAQQNYGLIAQDYVETTTTSVVEGLTADLPRLDYSGGASCPSLLLEPSRTNAITNSEYVDSWLVKTNISIVSNDGTSPEGVTNASNIYPTTTGACFFYENSITYTSGTTYTYSVFAKANGKDYLQIATSGASFSNQYCTFDLANGTKDNNGFEDADIEDYGNGWYRCYVVETSISTASSRFVIGLVNTATSGRLSSITADGTNGVLVYGVVSEAGSYPTSYIPTYGTAANRGAESCVKTGISSLIGQSEGTLFLDIVPQDKEFQIYYQARTTGSSNVGQIDIRYQSSNLRAVGADGGSTQFTISSGDIVVGQRYKCAVRYAENDVAFYVNGSLAGTDTSASFSSSTKGQITFNENAGSFLPHAEVKQALVFPTGLTNAELAALTTI